MRLDELVLRVPGDELRVRFHEQLTVLCGIGMLERQTLSESLISALAGTADDTVLTYTDRTGRQVEIVSTKGTAVARYTEDDAPAPLVVGSATQSADELRSLMLVQAGDLGLTATRTRDEDDPELRDARALLADLTQELQASMVERHAQQVVREELASVEAQLKQADENAARREYARVLADLERVRAESAALKSGRSGAESDRALLTSADDARKRAERWTEAARRVAQLAAEHGGERLDPHTVSQVHTYPAVPPANLRELLSDLEHAREQRDRLDQRLRERATSKLPQPSDPCVVRLAISDQNALWSARDHLDAANRALQREQLAVGGPAADTVDDGGVASSIVARIEEAQHAVDAAEALRQTRFVPCVSGSALTALGCLILGPSFPIIGLVLLIGAIVGPAIGLGLPWRQLAAARAVERSALADAGAETYLGFHLRRVDAATDPGSHRGLDAAAMEHRLAATKWEELAGGIDTASATALEAESRHYAQEVSKLGSAAGEIEALRAELTGQAEPAFNEARARLIEECKPYGVDETAIDTTDATLVERLIHTHVALGHRARTQLRLEQAEDVAQSLADELDAVLRRLGFTDGTLDARAGAVDWAVDRAFEREQARSNARPLETIEQDLVRLQAEAARLRRPEWASVLPSEAQGPDEEELLERATKLRAQINADGDVVIDLERLADRHSAMERRVAALEAEHGTGSSESAIAELADVHQYLLAHLTRAGHAGPFDESVPVILDEAFVRIAAERKWELLDMLRRLAEKTQLIYLSDDPFVGAWARRRAAAGLVTLLEPVEASA